MILVKHLNSVVNFLLSLVIGCHVSSFGIHGKIR